MSKLGAPGITAEHALARVAQAGDAQRDAFDFSFGRIVHRQRRLAAGAAAIACPAPPRP